MAHTTAALVLMSVLGTAPAWAADAPSPYAQPQADQGHQMFNNRCAQCHRPDLSGALGPPLVGAPFLSKWGGKSVVELMRFEHDNMPANSPGSMSDTDVATVTAYILSRNGVTAGSVPLSAATAAAIVLPPSEHATGHP